ncbi:hypothetical protein MNBD_NITROSPINAE04-535, partial [hydrothermal vent metagenome]
QSGKPEQLLDHYGMNAISIADAVHKAVSMKKEPVSNAQS